MSNVYAVVGYRRLIKIAEVSTHGDAVREASRLNCLEYAINRPDQTVDWSFYRVGSPAAVYRCREGGKWYGEDRELGRFLIRTPEEIERLNRMVQAAEGAD